jgi:sn-glycerol 3-phosphate transport system permease protein
MMSRNARIGILLLLPAAVLLVAFTFYPTVATLIDSFYSTPRARRPARFIGADHFRTMAADPIFHRAFVNNLIYAAVIIPASMGLALAMALFLGFVLGGAGAVARYGL